MVDLRIGGDPGNEKGYLEVTLRNSTDNETLSTTTSCGTVGFTTAEFACLNIGWVFTTNYGTVGDLGYELAYLCHACLLSNINEVLCNIFS